MKIDLAWENVQVSSLGLITRDYLNIEGVGYCICYGGLLM